MQDPSSAPFPFSPPAPAYPRASRAFCITQPSREEDGQSVAQKLEQVIAEAIPDGRIEVRAISPGHFEIDVISPIFQGRTRVQQQQLVYAAIAPLMSGDAAPVHAVDRLTTRTP